MKSVHYLGITWFVSILGAMIIKASLLPLFVKPAILNLNSIDLITTILLVIILRLIFDLIGKYFLNYDKK